MTPSTTDAIVDEALDNDVILKAVRYTATQLFWPPETRFGVLGVAPYVVAGRLKRTGITEARPATADELLAFLDLAQVLEPSEQELTLAGELEREAQRRALPLDTGESQLAAMVVERAIALLTTGDKRAIASFEQLLGVASWLAALCGRVRSLEQLALHVARDDDAFPTLSGCVCSDPDADTTLSICFGCLGGEPASRDVAEQGLVSYIDALRADAPEILAAAP